MASPRRVEKINNLIREQLSKTLDEELEFPEGTLVTITRVSASPDLHYADIFISVLGGKNKDKEALEILQKNVYNIQQRLNRQMRIRPVPKITFVIDEEERNREKVEKTLAELKRKGEV